MQDTQLRFVCYNSAQCDFDQFLVDVACRQPEDLVPLSARAKFVNQRLK